MTTVIHAPENTKPLTQIWAFVSVDDGGEGIIAEYVAGVLMPLVTGDEENMQGMRRWAEGLARQTGKRVRLLKFTAREDLGEVG